MSIFFITNNNFIKKIKDFLLYGYLNLFLSTLVLILPISIFLLVVIDSSLLTNYIKFDSKIENQNSLPEVFKSIFKKNLIIENQENSQENSSLNFNFEQNNLDKNKTNSIEEYLFNDKSDNHILNDKDKEEFDNKNNNVFLFGTNYLGNDLFTHLFMGFEIYLIGGLLSIVIAFILGIILGSLSSFYDHTYLGFFANFIINLISSFPKIFFLFLSVIIWGINLFSIMITIGIISSIKLANAISQRIKILKNQEFIDAYRQLGLRNFQILSKHILYYNCRDLFLLYLIFIFADTILLETTMAYFSFGIRWTSIFQNIDISSWGTYINEGKSWILNGYYWIIFFPTILILWVIFSLNLFANSLRKVLNI